MNSPLHSMIEQWQVLKEMEQRYNHERLKTEVAIQELLQEQKQWSSFGTMSFDGLKIRNSYRRLWDQKLLTKIKTTYQFEATQFPFVTEYKELKTQSDYLEKIEPSIWQKLTPALTVYANKPYFFIPEKRE